MQMHMSALRSVLVLVCTHSCLTSLSTASKLKRGLLRKEEVWKTSSGISGLDNLGGQLGFLAWMAGALLWRLRILLFYLDDIQNRFGDEGAFVDVLHFWDILAAVDIDDLFIEFRELRLPCSLSFGS